MAVLPSLADVQGKDFDTPHILIAERVGGMEDIPVSLLRESDLLVTAWPDLCWLWYSGIAYESAVRPHLSGTPRIRSQAQRRRWRRLWASDLHVTT